MTVTVPYNTMSTSPRSSLYSRCCCCFPLRTCCLILGYVHLAFITLNVYYLLNLATTLGQESHGHKHSHSNRVLKVSDSTAEKPLLDDDQWLIALKVAHFGWLVINTACLIGLHKKRPGPIKVYVAFATARLMLTVAGFVNLIMTANSDNEWYYTPAIIAYSFDISFTAYFIVIYYMYAVQLGKELKEMQNIPHPATVNTITFIYPAKLDKEALVP